MRVKEESEKVTWNTTFKKLRSCIWSHHFKANGGKVETVTDFIFLGSKITADSDWSHEIRRHLLLGSKAMTNLDSILKGRDITLSTKVYVVKAMSFPIVMYGCESWTIKKAEHWRIDAFELWSYRRLLQRRQWHPTPVQLPGKSHGQRSLVSYSPWGHKEADTTQRLHYIPVYKKS